MKLIEDSWKHQKAVGLLMFLGGIKGECRTVMGLGIALKKERKLPTQNPLGIKDLHYIKDFFCNFKQIHIYWYGVRKGHSYLWKGRGLFSFGRPLV